MMEQQQGLATPRERIEASMNLLTVHLQRDRESSQLLDALGGQNCFVTPTKSGLAEADYFKLPLQHIVREVNRTPLPPELLQHFQRMKCQFQTGIFPDIQRAWATVDSDLVIWNYQNGKDVVYYDGMGNVILAMDLIRPKQNIFRNHVHYLLALATPSEIAILGVTLAENTQTNDIELHFVNEPLYTYALENIVVTKIQGSRNGRIFLGAQDGSLYEFSYFAQRGWLQSLCKLTNCSSRFPLLNNFLPALFKSSDPVTEICVDNARQILYTLSDKGIICVYDLGTDGLDMSYVASAGEDSLLRNVNDCEPAQVRRVIHIECVPKSESTQVHLIAFTQSGARLFLTTIEASSLAQRPSVLSILHVRQPFSLPHKFTQVTNGLGLRSTALMLDQQNENRYFLVSLDHFSHFRRLNQFVETYSVMLVDKNIWSLSVAESQAKLQRRGEASTKFVMMSHNGCQILSKMTPTEQLRHLLAENRGAVQSNSIKTFFAYYNYLEGCVMCLQIICDGDIDPQIVQWARDVFLYYGGEPHVEAPVAVPQGSAFSQPFPQLHPQASMLNQTMLTGAPQQVMSTPFRAAPYMNTPAFPPMSPIGPHQSQMHPDLNMNQTMPPASMTNLSTSMQGFNQAFTHSFRHEAIILYFARILKPIFESVLAKESPPHAGESPKLSLELTGMTLTPIIKSLQGFKTFLQSSVNQPESGMSLHVGGDAQQWKRKAVLEEQNSLSNILLLLSHSMEILNLWKIVADHDLEMISRHLKAELFARLKVISVRDFLSSDKQFLSALATAVVNSYLQDGAATANVSEKLKDFCPSIYGNEDALYTEAFEKLSRAVNVTNTKEREALLETALEIYRKIPLQAINLAVICRMLNSARYYKGLVNICLWAAQSLDPHGYAVDFAKDRDTRDHDSGRRAYMARKECYTIVVEVLNELFNESQNQDVVDLTGRHYEEMLGLCFDAKDPLFHIAIFDWLVFSGQQEKLLHVRSGDLEQYLDRRAKNEPNSIETLDLMCRYHELNGEFGKAVYLLKEIANRPGNLRLSDRTTYLARAMLCAKSGGPSTADMLVQLQETLEVAKIQEQIAEQLPDERRALDERLLTVNQLYRDFAEKYELPECRLKLLLCGGYVNLELNKYLWVQLIDKALMKSELAAALRSACPAFVNHPDFFPLDAIISHCEAKTQHLENDPLWLPETLSSVGVPWPTIQAKYHELYATPEYRIIRERLLTVLASVIQKIANKPELIPRDNFRGRIQRILSNVATYMVELQSRITDPDMEALMISFRRSSAQLENLAAVSGGYGHF